jgi:CHAT domain-containing protein/tetratricopeptide (TPR) repeat protein
MRILRSPVIPISTESGADLEPHVIKKGRNRILGSILASLLLLGLFACKSEAQEKDDSASLGRLFLQRGLDLAKRERYDSAYACYEKATLLLRERDWNSYLICANGRSKVLSVRGYIDSAEASVKAAFALAGPNVPETSLAVAETYSLLAYYHSYFDRPDSAIALSYRSLRIRQSLLGSEAPLLAGDFYTIGLAYRKKGFYSEAILNLQESLRLFSGTGKATGSTARILMLLGNVHRERADYDEATRYLDSSLSVLRSQGLDRSHSMVTGMIYLALCQVESGQFSRALSLYDSAAALIRSIDPGNQAIVASIRAGVGRVYDEMGDVDRALDAFSDCSLRTEANALGNASGTAEVLQLSAEACIQKGDFTSARGHSINALRLKSETLGANHPDVASAHEVLAQVEEGTKNYVDALRHLREALRIRLLIQGTSNRPDLVRLMLGMAVLYEALKRREEASATLERASRYAQQSHQRNPVLMARLYETEADIHHARKELKDAAAHYERALAALSPDFSESTHAVSNSHVDLAHGIHLLRILKKKGACLEESAGRAGPAIRTLRSALDAYNRGSRMLVTLRSNYESEGSKFRLLEEFSGIYESGIRVSLLLRDLTHDQTYLASAFSFAEWNKAGILLEGIRGTRVRAFAGVPQDVLHNERSLKMRLTACEVQLAKALDQATCDSARVQALRWRTISLREDLRRVREGIRRAYPLYARLSECDTLPLVEKVQQVLDDSTLIMEYFLGDARGYLFLIDKRKLDVRILRSPAKIAAAATSLTRSIRMVDYDDFLGSARQVYSDVISPAGRAIAAYSRLVIVPDKILSNIPFEALVTGPGGQSDERQTFSTLPFLVKSHEISVAPSASLFCESIEGANQTYPVGGTFAGFAPVFRESTGTGLILASNRFVKGLDTTHLRSVSIGGKRFRELPYSDVEVSGIAGKFAELGLPSRTFVNENASEGSFKQNAPLFSFLHVATHGLVNARDPNRSALLFAQPSDTASGEDGVLYAAEAYNLNLNAELVVLSSCESGIGHFVNGEGVYALMRGFLYSGARNIIYSLWQVMDHHTSELMEMFYEGVLKGWRFGKALQMAKMRMLANERTAFPFCWAGFVLVGQ